MRSVADFSERGSLLTVTRRTVPAGLCAIFAMKAAGR